jgi:outer membrane protein assembly factor BamB
MHRRVDLAPVELLEDDELEPQDDAAPARTGRRWWLLAIPVAVVGLALGTQQLIDARERAADARIAALPGVIEPVGGRLETVWQSDPGTGALAWGGVANDALHGVLVGPDGSLTYTALDLETGARAWSTTLRGPDPALTDPLNGTTTGCRTTAHDRAVCLVTDGYQRFSDTADDTGRPATQAHVVVLDLADGRVLADHPVAPVDTLAVLPDLVATAEVDDQQRLVVVARDPMTDDELWRFRDDEPWQDRGDGPAALGEAGDLIVVYNRPSGPLVLTAEGERLEPDDTSDTWATTRDGWLTWSRPNPDGGDELVHVLRPGEPPLEVTGDLLRRTVDDGSVPGLEVTTGITTRGWDGRTGKQLWQADVVVARNAGDQVMVLQGRVYLPTVDAVVALDGRDGTVVWSTPRSPSTTGGELLTDGRHLLLVQSPLDPSGTGDLLVMDRRNGTALRRTPLPAGITSAFVAGHRLISGQGTQVVGIG